MTEAEAGGQSRTGTLSKNPLCCTRCRAPVSEEALAGAEPVPCRKCGAPLQIEIFPAIFRRAAPGRQADLVVVENEASCFYHPHKKAVLPCESCGRFLCALCDCELQGQHLCPACLETGRRKGKLKNLENQRTLYDSIAFSLAAYPLLVLLGIYFTLITAPLALYIVIRYWKAPRSLVQPGRARGIVAMVLAMLQIGAWGALIFFLSTRRFHG